MSSTLILRADAGSAIGMGHVMRMFALAEAWRERGGNARCVCAEIPQTMRERFEQIGAPVEIIDVARASAEDARSTIVSSEREEAEWIVLDGYDFDARYIAALKDRGLRVLQVDDLGFEGSTPADIVLNGNVYADHSLYPGIERTTKLLLGSRYALLRREFRERPPERSVAHRVMNVLATLGGATPPELAALVARVLARLRPHGIAGSLVLGAASTARRAIAETGIEIIEHTSNMRALFERSDLVVSAAGSTTYELAYLGVPSILITIADNQRPIAERMTARGAASSAGWHQELDELCLETAILELVDAREARSHMSAVGRALLDGRGVHRVLSHLSRASISLRPASIADALMLFAWANERSTREASFSPAPIAWEDHLAWLVRRLDDADTDLYVAGEGDCPIGQVRFDRRDRAAVISVSIAESARGRRLAEAILEHATEAYFAQHDAEEIVALIKPENTRSIRAFSAAGFIEAETVEVGGRPARRFVLTRRRHT